MDNLKKSSVVNTIYIFSLLITRDFLLVLKSQWKSENTTGYDAC